jgi:hypothetical protein
VSLSRWPAIPLSNTDAHRKESPRTPL